MTPTQLKAVSHHYRDTFGCGIDLKSLDVLYGVDTLDDLDKHQEYLSAGEYDMAELVLMEDA